MFGTLFASPQPGDFITQFEQAADRAEFFRRERERLAAGPVTPEMVAALCGSPLVVADYSNALSPRNVAISALDAKGMLRRAGWEDGVTSYEITDAGRAELERQRVADLAKIGVYEVSSPSGREE